MHKLESEQYNLAQPLFSELAQFNLSVAAVLNHTVPGEVWVDNLDSPRVGFATTPEGHYLAGDVKHQESYARLKEIIPLYAYLIFHPEQWEGVVDQIWTNPIARRHPRQYFRFQHQRIPNWRDLVPDGFQLVRVDQDILQRTDLENHNAVTDWVDNWFSTDDFLEHGFGFCIICGDTIASWCLADCAYHTQCEIGIETDSRYRRRGLATLVVAATVDYALSIGFDQIGWHCLRSNAGSIGVAQKVGFAKVRDYFAYSPYLPMESASDMTPDDYREWALFYERAAETALWTCFHAAEAWALAGDPTRALSNLQRLIEGGWKGKPEWLQDNWVFDSMRGTTEFQAIVDALSVLK